MDIEIVPADSVGHLRLTLALGYPTGPCSYLRASFRTEYAWIARFEQALRTFIAAPTGKTLDYRGISAASSSGSNSARTGRQEKASI